jgi:hypothetical protein
VCELEKSLPMPVPDPPSNSLSLLHPKAIVLHKPVSQLNLHGVFARPEDNLKATIEIKNIT